MKKIDHEAKVCLIIEKVGVAHFSSPKMAKHFENKI
jgi:hypothetical protein